MRNIWTKAAMLAAILATSGCAVIAHSDRARDYQRDLNPEWECETSARFHNTDAVIFSGIIPAAALSVVVNQSEPAGESAGAAALVAVGSFILGAHLHARGERNVRECWSARHAVARAEATARAQARADSLRRAFEEHPDRQEHLDRMAEHQAAIARAERLGARRDTTTRGRTP